MDKSKNKKPATEKRGKKKRPLTRRPNITSKPVYHTFGVLDNCQACGSKLFDPPYIESREELTSGVTINQVVSDDEPVCPDCGWTHSRGVPVPLPEPGIPEYAEHLVPF